MGKIKKQVAPLLHDECREEAEQVRVHAYYIAQEARNYNLADGLCAITYRYRAMGYLQDKASELILRMLGQRVNRGVQERGLLWFRGTDRFCIEMRKHVLTDIQKELIDSDINSGTLLWEYFGDDNDTWYILRYNKLMYSKLYTALGMTYEQYIKVSIPAISLDLSRAEFIMSVRDAKAYIKEMHGIEFEAGNEDDQSIALYK